MFIRALIAFLALPGVFAFALPLLLARFDFSSFNFFGLPPVCAGIALLLWCVRDFYVAGKGTLVPWSLPLALVTVGLYRYSRNPMYIAVALILSGWALGFRSPGLAVYGLIVILAFHLRVVFGEEPWLERRYGDEWRRYKQRVPRWLL
jgi:protein-S-isoprenylcysteine O-methyltransferase Ste14